LFGIWSRLCLFAQNDVGNRKTSNAVAFSGNQRFIGDEALSQYMSNSKNTILNIKRLLGRSANDPEFKLEQAFTAYNVVDINGRLGVEVNYDDKQERLLPEQIAAAMLAKCKRIAEAGLEATVNDCVITVPQWWTDAQRRALLDAANIAGLNVLQVMNELAAVSLYYWLPRLAKLTPAEKEQEQKDPTSQFWALHPTATSVAVT